MTYTWNMFDDSAWSTRNTTPTLAGVPKTSRPPKVPKSCRVRPKLLEAVEAKCEEEGLTFNDAVERALEEWVKL